MFLLTYVYDMIVCKKEQEKMNKKDIILNLALENDLIKPTNSDKPTSKNQMNYKV